MDDLIFSATCKRDWYSGETIQWRYWHEIWDWETHGIEKIKEILLCRSKLKASGNDQN